MGEKEPQPQPQQPTTTTTQLVEAEVPCYFLCPISLQMMRDPVTLPTGITYDRDGIERWLLAAATCPLTKQPVPADCHPTPNHTLRRLIHSWCHLHGHGNGDGDAADDGRTEAADRTRVATLVSRLHDAAASTQDELLAALRELRDVAAESDDRSRRILAAVPGAADALVTVLVAASSSAAETETETEDSSSSAATSTAVCDEALHILASLQLSSDHQFLLARVVQANNNNEALVDALVSALQRPNNAASRERAALLLHRATAAMPANRLVSLPEQLFRELVQLLRDRRSASASWPATKAALHVLVATTSWGRNRVKAADAGAVPVLVDMLFDGPGKAAASASERRRACELALAALDRLCGCAEGRADLVAHAAGVAAVGRKAMMRVSEVATDKAVRVLRSVARHASTAAVVQEMAQTGVVATLCLVAQSEQYGERTRERARETLRLHARVWRNSPCLHHHLRAIYPSSSS